VPRGGARPGAGRPLGSKDTRRPRWRRKALDPTTRAAFVAWCAEFAASGNAVEMLQDALSCGDPARRDRALLTALNYGIGLPQQRVTIKAPSLQEMLVDFHRERDALPPAQEGETTPAGEEGEEAPS
jgi:hypothetical protein